MHSRTGQQTRLKRKLFDISLFDSIVNEMQAVNMQSLSEIQSELSRDLLMTIGQVTNSIQKELQRARSQGRQPKFEGTTTLRNVRNDPVGNNSHSPRRPLREDPEALQALKRQLTDARIEAERMRSEMLQLNSSLEHKDERIRNLEKRLSEGVQAQNPNAEALFKKEIDDLRFENRQLKDRINLVQTDFDRLSRQKGSHEQLAQENGHLRRDIQELERQNAYLQGEIQDVRRQHDQATNRHQKEWQDHYSVTK
jgi:dynactin complex subunit